MANDCCYNMKVIGKKENIEKFYDWMRAEYSYHLDAEPKVYINDNGLEKPVEHHIGYRIFSSYMDDCVDYDGSGLYMGYIFGDCAWSVYCCMFDRAGTYLDDYKNEEGRKAISIVDAAKELNLSMEIFSEEPGTGLSEHYYITPNGLELEEERDLSEYEDEETEEWHI